MKGALLRVAFDYLDTRTNDQTAADFHILQLALPTGQRLVHQFREARAKAVVHPISRADRFFRSNFWGYKFALVVIQHNSYSSFCFVRARRRIKQEEHKK